MDDEPIRRAERLLLGESPRYTRRECAERAGVDLERATQLWRALGFPSPDEDELVFTDADVQALRTVTGLHELNGDDHTLELSVTRAIGQSMARLADWHLDTLRELVATSGPADPTAATESGLTSAQTLLPRIEELQRYVWRRHLLAATERALTAPAAPEETATMAVGFADVVGFTSLSRGLTETRLSEFLEQFEGGAAGVVTEHGGRVIKTVGDEVMFTADTAEAGAAIGIELAERLSALDRRPGLRTGVAYGPVLRRLGDVYGTVVNIASRLTALARPGTVLVDRELAEALDGRDEFELRKLRRVSVRGYAHLQPWLLRRS